MKSKVSTILLLFFTLGILLLGAGVRLDRLAFHFGHLDDLGVAVTLLETQKEDPLKADALRKILDSGRFVLNDEALRSIPNGEVNQYRFAAALNRFGLSHFAQLPVFDSAISLSNHVLRYLAIPVYWTYAPLQFIGTSFLVSESQSYRDVLFWGRFPSMFFGCLALLFLCFFYQRFGASKTGENLSALALLACSWPAVIFSKQMHNYSLGVFAAVCLLILLVRESSQKNSAPVKTGFLLALLCAAHYQIIFLIPAFCGALWWKGASEAGSAKKNMHPDILRAFFFWLLFALPTSIIFLIQKASRGVNDWNRGVRGEYLFSWDASKPLAESFLKAVYFYADNFIVLVNSQLAFAREDIFDVWILSLILPMLVLAGFWRFFSSKEKKDGVLGAFFLLTAGVWLLLTALGKLTLSPTRHSLILAPFLCVLVPSGLVQVCLFLKKFTNTDLALKCNGFLACLVIAGFLFSYSGEMERRRDVFDPIKIKAVLNRFEVKTVIGFNGTLNLSLMPEVTGNFQYLDERFRLPRSRDVRFRDLGDTIALVSHNEKLNAHVRQRLSDLIKRETGLQVNLKDYRLIYSEEVNSNTEIEFSSRTKNGTNGFFLYVLSRKKT